MQVNPATAKHSFPNDVQITLTANSSSNLYENLNKSYIRVWPSHHCLPPDGHYRSFYVLRHQHTVSKSKTDSTIVADSCSGPSTPAQKYHGPQHHHADKAGCSSSAECTGHFQKETPEITLVKHIRIHSSASSNSTQNQQEQSPALWQGWSSLSSQEELGNKNRHKQATLCQNVCSPILAHRICYMQLVASTIWTWKN